jgi:hypothetical protein
VYVRIVLDDLVNGTESALSPELREHFVEAWPEIRVAFQTLDRSIASTDSVPKLASVGLTGSPLRLKVAGLRRAFGRMMRGGVSVFRRRARFFLAWGNTILGSLSSVFPVAELIKEYKECIEHDLAEQEAESRTE